MLVTVLKSTLAWKLKHYMRTLTLQPACKSAYTETLSVATGGKYLFKNFKL